MGHRWAGVLGWERAGDRERVSLFLCTSHGYVGCSHYYIVLCIVVVTSYTSYTHTLIDLYCCREYEKCIINRYKEYTNVM